MTIKKAAAALALLVVALCAWLGASIYVGRTASQTITKIANTFVSKPFTNPLVTPSKVTLVDHKHEQGLFSSTGQLTVRFKKTAACSACETDPPTVDIQVDYRASNLLLPNAFMRVDWSAKPKGEIGKIINQHFEKEITLTGEAKQDYSGKVMSTLKLSELVGLPDATVDDQKVKLIVTPSTGFVSWKDQATTFDWKTERLSLVTEDGKVKAGAEGFSASADILDRMLSVGTMQAAVAKWQTEKNTVGKGYSLKYTGLARGDRLDVTVNQKADEIAIDGGEEHLLSDLVLDLSLNDLDNQSLVEANKYLSQYAEEGELSTEDEARMRASIRKLIDKGLKFSVAKLSAKYQEATGQKKTADLNGKMVLEVLKAETNATSFDVAKSVRSSGDLLASGSAVNAMMGLYVAFGIGETTKDGVKFAYDFDGKTFTAFGKEHDASDAIKDMNEKINSTLYK